MSSTDLENVGPHSWRTDTFTLDIELSKPHEENIFAADYYEILRVGPRADLDSIERIYRTLADRFHPDNPSTGDPETFLRLKEAYETLSNQAARAKYNVVRESAQSSKRFWLRGREFFDGVRGGQNRRLAVLCLLYRRRISLYESPGLAILDLEQLTGCTREELTSALWYLSEKNWATIGELSDYSITVDGFDVVESKVEDRLEFRALATLSYYGLPAELEDPADIGPRFRQKYTLPLDVQSATTNEGVHVADHYEILGIGPQADEETIERVYRTLAGRFHPDNPSSGNAETFLRIREAYNILSHRARRAEYDALRHSTEYSERFHLRGREFFDGIKGEQLRRLAVLCHLYRQAASELPGLAVLNLEQLTGCTREELGSALWYLREKKWAKLGEFSEYTITAAGFDIVENKMDDREATRSRSRLIPEDSQGTPQSPLADITIPPENRNSEQIAEREHPDTEADAPSNENVAVVQAPIPIDAASGIEEQVVPVEVDAEQPPAEEPLSENVEVAQRSIPNDEASDIAEQVPAVGEQPEAEEATNSWAWLYPDDSYGNGFVYPPQVSAEQEPGCNQRNVPVAPQCAIANTTIAHEARSSRLIAETGQTNIKAEAVQEPINKPVSPQAATPDQSDVKITPQSPGVNRMNNSTNAIAGQAGGVAVSAGKRVILSMGGKGGVGKTSVMTGLAEWFDENRIPVTLLDLDIENKVKGSLTHFFDGRVPKINIHTPAGLDAFVDHLGEGAPVILADMGAGAGQITHDWFEKMYPDVAETGVAFTAIGVVTSDPASVESVLNWAAALQDRVAYVIVENNLTEHTDFTYWHENVQAEEFRNCLKPAIIRHDYRLADLENAARKHGVTLGRIAGRTTSATELQKASLVMRAQSYRRRIFAEFDRVKELLVP